MTAPHEPQQPSGDELGSTQQFRAFVQHNDAPEEARERAAADPDGPRQATTVSPAAAGTANRGAPAATPNAAGSAATADVEDDREIQFSGPPSAGPPVRSPRPDVELPPAELGSTAQFRAFASGAETDDSDRPAPSRPERAAAPAAATTPVEPRPAGPVQPSAPPLPPADPSGKRNLMVALAVILLVVVAVVLLFVLI